MIDDEEALASVVSCVGDKWGITLSLASLSTLWNRWKLLDSDSEAIEDMDGRTQAQEPIV